MAKSTKETLAFMYDDLKVNGDKKYVTVKKVKPLEVTGLDFSVQVTDDWLPEGTTVSKGDMLYVEKDGSFVTAVVPEKSQDRTRTSSGCLSAKSY